MQGVPTFEQIAEFIREFALLRPDERIASDTQLDRDLGITGDDGSDLLLAAEKRFGVTLSRETFDLKPNEFLFGPEASLLDFVSMFRYRKSVFRPFTAGEFHEAISRELMRKAAESLQDKEAPPCGEASNTS